MLVNIFSVDLLYCFEYTYDSVIRIFFRLPDMFNDSSLWPDRFEVFGAELTFDNYVGSKFVDDIKVYGC